jgi:elongation factor G
MHEHATHQIRNVALVGHSGVGKTTLAEAMLHRAGVLNRPGSVDQGTSALDREPEAISRKGTVSTGIASFGWTCASGEQHWINLLDTPGNLDFEAELDAALAVVDLAVIVVSATEGVEAGTHEAWSKCRALGLPRMIFVTREDKHRANFDGVVGDLVATFGNGFATIELPLGEEGDFHGVADVLAEEAHEYEPDGRHHVEPLPGDVREHEHAVHERVVEEIVSGDDAQLERYLEGEEPSLLDLEHTLAAEVLACTEFPVLVGSGATGVGVDRLIEYICELGPSPAARPVTVRAGDQPTEIVADPAADPLAFVFKTVSDQYVGQVSMFKVLSGTLRPDIVLRDVRTGADERLHSLLRICGAEQTPAGTLVAGDIGAVTKLTAATTGTTLAPANQPVVVTPPPLHPPHLAIALVPQTQSDDDKLSEALHRLVLEDPALTIDYDTLSRRTVLRGTGDAHLSVAISRLERKYGVRVGTEPVRIEYRRTISRAAEVEGRVKKQSGGHGQFAVVSLRVTPLERGQGFEFVDAIVGGAIPKNYVAAVRQGIDEAMSTGGQLAIPIVDVRVECIDGKTHSVDSSEMAFRTAAALGFAQAVDGAGPVLLEPVSSVLLRIPSEAQGDVLGDLSARRGRIIGSNAGTDGHTQIEAEVPTAELQRYASELKAMTAGRGRLAIEHCRYSVVPDHLTGEAIASYSGNGSKATKAKEKART